MQQLKTANWIIGASSGIGEALALELAEKGEYVICSARSEQALNELCEHDPDNMQAIVLDITDVDQVTQAVTQIAEQGIVTERIIINAGTCEYLDSWTLDLDSIERVMKTNFFGVVQVINASLPLLRKAAKPSLNTPQLVVMSSSVSYQALPRAHVYGASKAALRYFTECLKIDLQHEGIDVRVVSPGFVKTPLTDKNDFEMPFLITSRQAAQRIISGLASSRFDIAFPKRFTWMLKAFSKLPDRLKFHLLAKASRHPEVLAEHGQALMHHQ